MLDNATGLLMITSEQYANLKTLNFNIGGTSYGLTPNGQIWPRSLNTDIGGSSNNIYLVINDIGPGSGPGLNFINGYSFLFVFQVTLFGINLTTCPTVNVSTLSSTPLITESVSQPLRLPLRSPTKTIVYSSDAHTM